MKKDIIIERPDGAVPGLLDINETLCSLFGVVVALVLEDGKLQGIELRKAHIEGEEIIVGDKPLCDCPKGAHYGALEVPGYCTNCGAHCLAMNDHVRQHFAGL